MELDLTAAIKAASRAVAEKRQGQHVDPPSARTVGYAEAAVRAAAVLIERAVLEEASKRLRGLDDLAIRVIYGERELFDGD